MPGPDDDAIIGTGYAQSTSDRIVASLTVNGGSADLPNLTVGLLNLSGGTLRTTSTTVSGYATWTGGEIGGAIGISTGATLAIPSGIVRLLTNATLTNSGTVLMSGGQLEGYDTVVIHNHGTWNLSGHEAPFVNFYWTNTFHNHGLLRKAGTTGVIHLQNGWIYHLGGETRCETGELRFAGTDHHLPQGAQLTGAGTLRMVSGTTHLEGTITETAGNLILDGATLDASGSAAVTGTLDWMSGSLSGILTIPSGSRMEVHGDGFKRMNIAAEIVVNGTYRWTGPAGSRATTNAGSASRREASATSPLMATRSTGFTTPTNASMKAPWSNPPAAAAAPSATTGPTDNAAISNVMSRRSDSPAPWCLKTRPRFWDRAMY